MRTRRSSPLVRFGLLALLAGLGAPPATAAAPESDDATVREQVAHARALSAAFKHVARTVQPSVVFIGTINREPTALSPRDEMLLRRGLLRQAPPRERRGAGSGVILTASGHIVTNNHVIDGADELLVRLADGREFAAIPVGVDPDTDLAVIRIEAPDLVPAKLGDSDALDVGEWVLALGNPFGLEQSVTAGIVSAKGRAGVGLARYENYIQTDAAINPGNSGGPLVNLDGEVVGINAGITTRTGGSLGIGFAIPAAMVRTIAESLISDGVVARGWLGVVTTPVPAAPGSPGNPGNPGNPETLGNRNGVIAPRAGVRVDAIAVDGPAHRAGVRPGDIIVAIAGRPTADPDAVGRIVGELRPEQRVSVELFRAGRALALDAKLADRTVDPRTRFITGREAQQALGLRLAQLTRELAQRAGATATEGVVVVEIAWDSAASRAGLRPGDVVLRVAGRPVATVDEFEQAAYAAAETDVIPIEFERRGEPASLTIRVR